MVGMGKKTLQWKRGLSRCRVLNHVFLYTFSMKYYISAGDNSTFRIAKSNTHPKLVKKRKLDHAITSHYSVVVIAQDLANQCRKSRAIVQINVIDPSDIYPIFKKKEYTASIPRNAKKGAFVIKVFSYNFFYQHENDFFMR